MCIIRDLAVSEAQHFAGNMGEREQWKVDHDAAMFCYTVEYDISRGIAVFELITRADENWRKRVATGKEPYSVETHGAIKGAYRTWTKPAEIVLKAIETLEAQRFEVARADEFRSVVREVRGILTPDAEFFGEGLVSLRDDAIDAHARGETIEHWPAQR